MMLNRGANDDVIGAANANNIVFVNLELKDFILVKNNSGTISGD